MADISPPDAAAADDMMPLMPLMLPPAAIYFATPDALQQRHAFIELPPFFRRQKVAPAYAA